MNCPLDGSELSMMDRQGIEIDYCPKCRGVWLDRGELDKMLESSRRQPMGDRESDDRDFDDRRLDDRRGDDRRESRGYPAAGHYPHKRKESFWERIFDFD